MNANWNKEKMCSRILFRFNFPRLCSRWKSRKAYFCWLLFTCGGTVLGSSFLAVTREKWLAYLKQVATGRQFYSQSTVVSWTCKVVKVCPTPPARLLYSCAVDGLCSGVIRPVILHQIVYFWSFFSLSLPLALSLSHLQSGSLSVRGSSLSSYWQLTWNIDATSIIISYLFEHFVYNV